MAKVLQDGEKAPDFSMPSTTGQIKLEDFSGSYLVARTKRKTFQR